MTRILLIAAGPTKWDEENRVVGNHSLPLTLEGRTAMERLVAELPLAVDAVYHCCNNEAAVESARIVARRFGLRPKDNADLEEFNAGLWQGMRWEDIAFRYPSVNETWEDNPLAVEPPEGETIPEVTERLQRALKAIVRRNKGRNVAIIVRPVSQQILAGLLGREPLEQICHHLQERVPLETIELSDEQVRQILS